MGMTYAAEQALEELKQQPEVMSAVEAYTAGVNHFIQQLQPAQYPIEYKLLDYEPEDWTPLKTTLFLKYMSYDLAADFDDFEHTNLRQHIGQAMHDLVFPYRPDSLDPIALRSTVFATDAVLPVKPARLDSLYESQPVQVIVPEWEKPDPDNGSNNWVVGGIKTASGRPILCNDPHLGLNLPSLWYEMQIHTPGYNTYGVSFPGSPAIIIGFNDSIAWGVTNSSRDVMDFYEVKFRDSSMNEYLFNGAWKKTEWRTEVIGIRGKADFTDKIAMTVWGPVMYDASFANGRKDGKAYAIRWKAHDPSNELRTFMGLNRADNYNDYLDALSTYTCPSQNFVFASKTNEIAVWQQAKFPAKWRGQGDFVMPGWDSSFAWQGWIPQQDNIHVVNPERGFVSSANQLPADTSYPFYMGGNHDVYRGFIINRYLRKMDSITAADMQKMQTDNYNVFAEIARPLLLNNLETDKLSEAGKILLDDFSRWNLRADVGEKGQTIFTNWWANLADTILADDLRRTDGLKVPWPDESALVDVLKRDTAFVMIDDRRTTQKETLPQLVTAALNRTAEELKTANGMEWGKYKATRVNHLTGLVPFSRTDLNIGGGDMIINATKQTHGPSWRMIVHLTNETEAYGVYPGGQSGNPGSRFYDQFVQTWAKGDYNKLWIMKAADGANDRVKWKMEFTK
jgi:penicillin amidase